MPRLEEMLRSSWGSTRMAVRGRLLETLRFYQRRGFRLAALRRDAVTDSRRSLKPEIPEIGAHGVPIRDELELELPAEEWPAFVERYAWPQA